MSKQPLRHTGENDAFPDVETVSSATECTGLMPAMVYSEEEISPLDNQLTMKSIDVSDGTGVVLKAVETEIEDISTFFTKGEPMIVYAEKGAWYRIGIAVQNPTDEDIIVVINVENVEVRIE